MKPILTTTACIITATVVCAQISNDEKAIDSLTPDPIVQKVEAGTLLANPFSENSASIYGVFGAATMALLIATRRTGNRI